VARKRGEKGYATRTSSASAFVVRQQTKQGRWLPVRVTLASYNTTSGRLVLCLNHVLDYEPTHHLHSTTVSSVADYTTRLLNDQRHETFSESASSPQTTHCDLLQKVESSTATELHTIRSKSQPAESSPLVNMPEMKTTLSRCWAVTDLQLASFDPAPDQTCSWQMNGKRPNSHVTHEWSKPYVHRHTPDDFISYQDVNNCNQLQQLLNCDSSYMITQSTNVTNQSAYVDLIDRNILYQH